MKEVRMQSALKFISDPTNLQQLAFGDHKVPPPAPTLLMRPSAGLLCCERKRAAATGLSPDYVQLAHDASVHPPRVHACR
eukprot:6346649-Prymnesium_polylepis.1